MSEEIVAAVIRSYRDHAKWVLDQASALEAGSIKFLIQKQGAFIDESERLAAEYRSIALNIVATVQSCERLRPRE